MKRLACGLAASLLSGCATLLPTADQVSDDAGTGSVIYGDNATVSITYAGKKSSRPVFLVTVTNETDDTLFLEPQILRYFASSTPFVAVEDAPDDWMELSARNSKLPMTMQFAVDPRTLAAQNSQSTPITSTWKTVLPHETIEERIHLQPETLYKYYRLVMTVSDDYYVFDFVRNGRGNLAAGLVLLMLEIGCSWAEIGLE